MGRKPAKESNFYKKVFKIVAQCPYCGSWDSTSLGKLGRLRYLCRECGKTYYLTKEAKEVI